MLVETRLPGSSAAICKLGRAPLFFKLKVSSAHVICMCDGATLLSDLQRLCCDDDLQSTTFFHTA